MKFQLLLTLLPLSASFLAPPKARSFHLVLNSSPVLPPSSNQPFLNENENENEDSITSIMNQFETAPISALLPFAALLVPFQEVMAKGGEYGILEGRIGSMLHPVTMLLLFATSLHSAYLGLQHRKLREVGEQLKQLSTELPKLSSGVSVSFPITDTLSTLKSGLTSLSVETDTAKISSYKRDIEVLGGLTSLDATYKELVASRKSLVASNARDKHYLTGSVLLGVGVGVSLLGAMNTFLRAGKLFPGPHLYAGAAITGLWAAAAALVPAMQKGNDAARAGHIALNTVNVALFAWQVVTGFDIMVKVWEKTSWP